jgi:hypothetical protein
MIALLTSLAACTLLREPQRIAQPNVTPRIVFPAVHVTADQVARAMQEDHFFADYGQTTLFVQGIVLSVNQQNNDLVVELDTSIPTKLLCDTGGHLSTVHIGDTIIVKSDFPQRDASRQTSAVMLRNCSIP